MPVRDIAEGEAAQAEAGVLDSVLAIEVVLQATPGAVRLEPTNPRAIRHRREAAIDAGDDLTIGAEHRPLALGSEDAAGPVHLEQARLDVTIGRPCTNRSAVQNRSQGGAAVPLEQEDV